MSNLIYGVPGRDGGHIDISRSVQGAMRVASKDGYNTVTSRNWMTNTIYTAFVKVGAKWFSPSSLPATFERYGTLLRVYDNNGRSFDRYTILPPKNAKQYKENGLLWSGIGSSENPFHPQGFGMSVSAMPGAHLGKRIHWDDLPDAVKHFARQSFPDITRGQYFSS